MEASCQHASSWLALGLPSDLTSAGSAAMESIAHHKAEQYMIDLHALSLGMQKVIWLLPSTATSLCSCRLHHLQITVRVQEHCSRSQRSSLQRILPNERSKKARHTPQAQHARELAMRGTPPGRIDIAICPIILRASGWLLRVACVLRCSSCAKGATGKLFSS